MRGNPTYAARRTRELAAGDLHPLRRARHRHGRGLSRRELAERSGVHAETIKGIELGHSEGSARSLRALSEALAVPMDELLP